MIQRLVEAGRTDHTTVVREILERILGETGQPTPAPGIEQPDAAPTPAPAFAHEIEALVKQATKTINAAADAAAQRLAALEAELRQKAADATQTQPEPDHSAELAGFLQSARETFDIVLTQSTAKLALLESDLRKVIDHAMDAAIRDEATETNKKVENAIHEARTKIQDDAQRALAEATKNIESLENTVRETLSGVQAQQDHSTEISNFLQTARKTLDDVLTESVEKVVRLDSDLRAQIEQLSQLKEGVRQDVATSKRLLSELAARPQPKVTDLTDLTARQETNETKLSQLEYSTSKLAEDFAAFLMDLSAIFPDNDALVSAMLDELLKPYLGNPKER